MSFEPVLTKNVGHPEAIGLEGYVARGGYESLKKAFAMAPADVIQLVKESGLRGRGGAGFPAGMKWSFLPKDHPGPFYMAVNFDESEPGTFKDRYIADNDPHQIIEGIIVSSYATRASGAFIFIRGEFVKQAKIMEKAIQEAYKSGYLGDNIQGSGYNLELVLHRGAGAYVCGEETAMLEALEGKRGWPRTKPPFPAVEGAFGKPTIINNVETLCCVPHIINKGSKWFSDLGTEKSSGMKLFGISGHINNPGVYELPMGIPCNELIEKYGGGIRGGKKVKAVIPGGVSTGVLTADELDCPMDFEGPGQRGCLGLGTAGLMVMDEDTCMVTALRNIVRFFAHESCGQCTPCREGVGWMYKILNRIIAGEGTIEDVEMLLELADTQGALPGKTICGLADGTSWAVKVILTKFRSEFDAKVTGGVSVGK